MGKLVQIRNVPDAAHRALKARAAEEGASLNAYLLELIGREVERPTVAEVLARAASRTARLQGSSVDAIRAGRDERDAEIARRIGR
jgi:antitoxin FitA